MLLEWIISSSQSPGIRLRCWSKLLRERDNREIPETWRQTTPGFLYGTDSVLRMLRELHDYIDHILSCFSLSQGNTTRCWTTSLRSCPQWWLQGSPWYNIALASWATVWADMVHWWQHCREAQISDICRLKIEGAVLWVCHMTIFDNTYKSSKLYMVDLDDWKYSSPCANVSVRVALFWGDIQTSTAPCQPFHPLSTPTESPWGQKAFNLYLGSVKLCIFSTKNSWLQTVHKVS